MDILAKRFLEKFTDPPAIASEALRAGIWKLQ